MSTASPETYGGGHPASLAGSLAVPNVDQRHGREVELAQDGIADLIEGEPISVEAPAAMAAEVALEVPDGIRDPIFPVVVLGIITLLAIMVIAATLAL